MITPKPKCLPLNLNVYPKPKCLPQTYVFTPKPYCKPPKPNYSCLPLNLNVHRWKFYQFYLLTKIFTLKHKRLHRKCIFLLSIKLYVNLMQ